MVNDDDLVSINRIISESMSYIVTDNLTCPIVIAAVDVKPDTINLNVFYWSLTCDDASDGYHQAMW